MMLRSQCEVLRVQNKVSVHSTPEGRLEVASAVVPVVATVLVCVFVAVVVVWLVERERERLRLGTHRCNEFPLGLCGAR